MRIDQMVSFVRMADCHSLKEASKALYITPQALSASLAKMERYPVLEGRLIACVSADSPLARRKKLSLKTIASYPLTCLSMNGQGDYDRLLWGYGKIKQVLITDSIQTWISATEDYNGISLIQENMMRHRQGGKEHLDNNRIVQIEIAEKVICRVYLVTRKGMSQVVRELLRELQKTEGKF